MEKKTTAEAKAAAPLCLDLTTKSSLEVIRSAYDDLGKVLGTAGASVPANIDELRRPLDCAVLNYLSESMPNPKCQTAMGVFVEGGPLYSGAFIQKRRLMSRLLCAIYAASVAYSAAPL